MASNSKEISAMRFTLFRQIPFGQFGVTEENLEFSMIGMKPSSSFLCVPKKETGTTSAQKLDIINLANLSYFQLTVMVDSAIVDPTGKNLAVRVGRVVTSYQLGSVLAAIYNLMQNVSVNVPFIPNLTSSNHWDSKFDFLFWKWITADAIVFVTRDAVYHKYLDDMSEPLKIFDRHATMKDYDDIFDYITEPIEDIHLLIGRRRNEGDGLVTGMMQLYCERNEQLNRVFPGQVAAFARFKVKGNTRFSTLLCYGYRNDGEKGKLFIEEMGPPAGNRRFGNKVVDMDFGSNDAMKGDFPMGIEINPKNGIIHVVTKFGDLHLYDLASGVCLFCSYQYEPHKYNPTINMLFTMACEGGCLGVSREGVIFIFAINEEEVIESVWTKLSNPVLAVDLALRNNWHGADDLIIVKFHTLLEEEMFTKAIEVAVKAPNDILRTKDTIQRLKELDLDRERDLLHLVKAYFSYLRENVIELNEVEKEEEKLLEAEEKKHSQEVSTPSQSHHRKRKHSPRQ